MQLHYGDRNGSLDEFFIADVGYEAPYVDVVGKVTEGIAIVVFIPEHTPQVTQKISQLESLLNDAVRERTHGVLMMPSGTTELPTEVFTCKEDSAHQCAEEFGVLSDEGIAALSLFVIARDNNIYHRQVLSTYEEAFKEKSFLAGISQAINCFTGVGCHG